MAKVGRPKGKSPTYVDLGLRATIPEYELIQKAAEKNAARLHIVVSRNNFCLRAVVAAAKKELGIPDDVIENGWQEWIKALRDDLD